MQEEKQDLIIARQYLYQLRDLEKKGKALLDAGITREVLDSMYNSCDESE